MIMYRCPGQLRHITRGFLYDQREMADVEKAKAEGWFDTLDEAAGLSAPVVVEIDDDAPPTRDELEQKADELGIKVDGRWSDKRVSDAIAAKLKKG